jgi:hypothetical protein
VAFHVVDAEAGGAGDRLGEEQQEQAGDTGVEVDAGVVE